MSHGDNDDDIYPFAILMPVTSKNNESEILQCLKKVAKNLSDNQSIQVPFRIYMGIDIGDRVLDDSRVQQELTNTIFDGFHLKILRFQPTVPVGICQLWNSLAHEAMIDQCKYFLLYGDDVTITCKGYATKTNTNTIRKWPDIVHNHFESQVIPFFGVCALNDVTSAGFPTFPIITSLHMQIFDNIIIPHEFVNQDGDPYLWSLYRRYGASKFISDIELSNSIGGVQLLEDRSYTMPRYERQHIDWKGDILQRGIRKVNKFIRSLHLLTKASSLQHLKDIACFTLDIIVPSYRVKKEFLLPIIALQPPTKCDLMIIIIVDDPNADIQWLREIEKDPMTLGKVRVRKNTSNLGASRTRNVGHHQIGYFSLTMISFRTLNYYIPM